MTYEQVLDELSAMADPTNLEGQARFGIDVSNSLGIPITQLRPLARRIGRNHHLAMALWNAQIREARILATLVDDPKQVSEEQMEEWSLGFRSWEVVDAACCNLFDRTPLRFSKAVEWAGRDEEFVKRAGFSLMAGIAVHDKRAADEQLLSLIPVIEREACDNRNFVRKAVSWALRQIGKRNIALNRAAIEAGERIAGMECKGARWVASDALKELRSPRVQQRLSLSVNR